MNLEFDRAGSARYRTQSEDVPVCRRGRALSRR